MLRILVVIVVFYSLSCTAQKVINLQDFGHHNTLKNIEVTKLAGDSLVTSFHISIMDTVATHKHLFHSEHVLILDGKGFLYMHDERVEISEGSFIFIPKETWHAVKVIEPPLRAISIQAPEFNGDDRVLRE